MSGVEDQDVATSLHGLGLKQRMRSGRGGRSWPRKNGSIVILKYHGVFVFLILFASCACVSRTEVALGVELGKVGRLRRLSLSQPRAFRAMGRHKNMFTCKGVDCSRYEGINSGRY